jgi:hypothetical protein
MFEKIFACLLRLYPSHFRNQYEEEARQLLRERFRDERGFFPRSRLCLDLLVDFAAGLPRAYQTAQREASAASVLQNVEGIPSFHVLDNGKTGPGTILVAGVLSLSALSIFTFFLSHTIPSTPPAAYNGPISPIEAVMQRLNATFAATAAGNPRRQAVSSDAKIAAAPESKAPAPAVAPMPPQAQASRAQPIRQYSVVRNETKPPATGIVIVQTDSALSGPQVRPQPGAWAVPARNLGGEGVHPTAASSAIFGVWHGMLRLPQHDRRTVVEISQAGAGQLNLVFHSLDLTAPPLPVTSASFQDGNLTFAIQSINGKYEGKMARDGMSIAGTWTQGPISRPLLLTRTTP